MELLLMIAGAVLLTIGFAFLSRKFGYKIGAGLAKSQMEKMGLTEDDKEAHE